MADVRRIAFTAHAAAREVADCTPVRSAGCPAGQAMATAHVPAHAIAAAIQVATTARDAAAINADTDAATLQERVGGFSSSFVNQVESS